MGQTMGGGSSAEGPPFVPHKKKGAPHLFEFMVLSTLVPHKKKKGKSVDRPPHDKMIRLARTK